MKHMKKCFAVFIAAMLCLMLAMAVSAADGDVAVAYDKDGNEIGTYTTLDDAFKYVSDGGKVQLLSAVTLTSAVTVSTNNVTLDLNGFDITNESDGVFTVNAQSFTITGKGTISGINQVIRLKGTPTNGVIDVSLYIGKDVTVKGIAQATSSSYAISAGNFSSSTEFDSASYYIENYGALIGGNRTSSSSGSDAINLLNVHYKVNSTRTYMPAQFTIQNHGTITGGTGTSTNSTPRAISLSASYFVNGSGFYVNNRGTITGSINTSGSVQSGLDYNSVEMAVSNTEGGTITGDVSLFGLGGDNCLYDICNVGGTITGAVGVTNSGATFGKNTAFGVQNGITVEDEDGNITIIGGTVKNIQLIGTYGDGAVVTVTNYGTVTGGVYLSSETDYTFGDSCELTVENYGTLSTINFGGTYGDKCVFAVTNGKSATLSKLAFDGSYGVDCVFTVPEGFKAPVPVYAENADGDSTVVYNLANAFDYAGNGGKVQLRGDVEITNTVTVDNGSVELDLNGFDITNASRSVFNLSGSMKLSGSGTVSGKDAIKLQGSVVLDIGENVTVKGADLSNNGISTAISANYEASSADESVAIVINNYGKLIGGTKSNGSNSIGMLLYNAHYKANDVNTYIATSFTVNNYGEISGSTGINLQGYPFAKDSSFIVNNKGTLSGISISGAQIKNSAVTYGESKIAITNDGEISGGVGVTGTIIGEGCDFTVTNNKIIGGTVGVTASDASIGANSKLTVTNAKDASVEAISFNGTYGDNTALTVTNNGTMGYFIMNGCTYGDDAEITVTNNGTSDSTTIGNRGTFGARAKVTYVNNGEVQRMRLHVCGTYGDNSVISITNSKDATMPIAKLSGTFGANTTVNLTNNGTVSQYIGIDNDPTTFGDGSKINIENGGTVGYVQVHFVDGENCTVDIENSGTIGDYNPALWLITEAPTKITNTESGIISVRQALRLDCPKVTLDNYGSISDNGQAVNDGAIIFVGCYEPLWSNYVEGQWQANAVINNYGTISSTASDIEEDCGVIAAFNGASVTVSNQNRAGISGAHVKYDFFFDSSTESDYADIPALLVPGSLDGERYVVGMKTPGKFAIGGETEAEKFVSGMVGYKVDVVNEDGTDYLALVVCKHVNTVTGTCPDCGCNVDSIVMSYEAEGKIEIVYGEAVDLSEITVYAVTKDGRRVVVDDAEKAKFTYNEKPSVTDTALTLTNGDKTCTVELAVTPAKYTGESEYKFEGVYSKAYTLSIDLIGKGILPEDTIKSASVSDKADFISTFNADKSGTVSITTKKLSASASGSMSVTYTLTNYEPITVTFTFELGERENISDLLHIELDAEYIYGSAVAPVGKADIAADGEWEFTYSKGDGSFVPLSELVDRNGVLGVGEYTVKGVFTSASGVGETTLTFTVSPMTVVITPDEKQSKKANNPEPTLTYTHTELIGADKISGVLGRIEGEKGGTYAFTLGTLNAGENYRLVLDEASPMFTVKTTIVRIDPPKDLTFTRHYPNVERAIKRGLPRTAIAHTSDGGIIEVELEWTVENDDNDRQYKFAPEAVNIFRWTVVGDYEYAEGVSNTGVSGFIRVKNHHEPIEPITKPMVNENFTDKDIPEDLKDKGLDTTEKIEHQMKAEITKVDTEIKEEDTETYHVELMYSVDGGDTWVKADEEHFPDDGRLLVTIEAPTGTDPRRHEYKVVHMFTSDAYGKTPGDVEYPEYTVRLGNDGKYYLDFYVTGLSPITVGWKEIPVEDGSDDLMPGYIAVLLAKLRNREYTLTAEVSEGGSITPAEVTKHKRGTEVVCTITPDEGYEIASVTVDDVEVGAVNEYIFERFVGNHEIKVVFAKIEADEGQE